MEKKTTKLLSHTKKEKKAPFTLDIRAMKTTLGFHPRLHRRKKIRARARKNQILKCCREIILRNLMSLRVCQKWTNFNTQSTSARPETKEFKPRFKRYNKAWSQDRISSSAFLTKRMILNQVPWWTSIETMILRPRAHLWCEMETVKSSMTWVRRAATWSELETRMWLMTLAVLAATWWKWVRVERASSLTMLAHRVVIWWKSEGDSTTPVPMAASWSKAVTEMADLMIWHLKAAT